MATDRRREPRGIAFAGNNGYRVAGGAQARFGPFEGVSSTTRVRVDREQNALRQSGPY
jgi:hypothetical protein